MAAGLSGEPVGVGTKDPDSKLNYTIDWTDWLDGLSIGGSTWARATGSTGITIVTSSTTTKKTTVIVSSGTAGASYKLINRITTSTSTGAAQLIAERSLQINVLEL